MILEDTMKRIISILLLLAMTLSLFACEDDDTNETYGTYGTDTDLVDIVGPLNESKGLEYTLSEDEAYYIVSGIGSCTDAKVVIPDSYEGKPVKKIGDKAFFACQTMTDILIPDGVTSIGEEAFTVCEKLKSITIPKSVTSIAGSTFYGCVDLEKISVDTANPVYHSDWNGIVETESKTLIAGSNSTYISVDGSVTAIAANAFSGCYELTSVLVPDGVTSIGDGAFSDCYELMSVTVPASVTSIGIDVFMWCAKLTSLTVAPENPVYSGDGNCLIEKESKTLITGFKSSVIPADGSVTSIGDGAFKNCSSLSEITIPNSITSIGNAAFAGCTSMRKITFNGTVSEWNAIAKSENWDEDTHSFTVHCTDGEITK